VKPAEVEAYAQAAEAAYAAMYDSRRPKDHFDDAMSAFHHAIKAADGAGLRDEAIRLKWRREEVRAIYNSQFRGL
jgi:hypothetical protein